MVDTVTQRVPVYIDFMQAAQLIAACEQRTAIFEQHLANGVRDSVVENALVETLAAELAVRAAFRLSKSEALLDALFDATNAELEELAERDVPQALVTYWERGI